MRLINAFTIQRRGLDCRSGILDWLLSPYYLKRARPNDTTVLYTDYKSVQILGDLWPHIENSYDEVFTDLSSNNTTIFSSPKFEAMERELKNYGSDFIMLDNDLYAFPGFLDNVQDYCVYYMEPFYVGWYHEIINNEYNLLNAPSWFTWSSIPANCASIRINNKKLLEEYIKLFYSVKAENLTETKGHKAMIKEQWSIGELFQKEHILPQELYNPAYSWHKGTSKLALTPSEMIPIQEYLLFYLFPKTYSTYIKTLEGQQTINSNIKDISCFNKLAAEYRIGLLAPILEAQKNKKNNITKPLLTNQFKLKLN